MAQLQRESSAYLSAQQKLNPPSRAAVDSYNQVVARFNAQAGELKGEQAGIFKEQTAFNASVVDVNGRCGSQVVTQEIHDEVVIEQEKKSGEAKN